MSIGAGKENGDVTASSVGGGGRDRPEASPAALVRLFPEILPPRRVARMPVSYGVLAAGVAVLLGGGFVAGAQLLTGGAPVARVAQAAPADPTAVLLHHVEDEVRSMKVGLDALRANPENGRQDDAIRALKRSVDTLKQDVETVRSATGGAVAQLGAKIDKLDRDPGPKLAEISARLDRLDQNPGPKLAEIVARIDRLDRDPPAKLSEVTSRLERIERQISSGTPTGAIGAATRGPTSALNVPLPTPVPAAAPDVKASPKPATIEGWLLRDVYGGVALVEGREGRLREVSPGEFVPGVGEIRSIERRGRSWVVVTSRGLIEADNRF